VQSSRITTLFAEVPTPRREPSVFLLSLLLHGVALSVLYVGLKNAVRIDDNLPAERYIVRLLNLQNPQPRARESAGQGAAQSAARSTTSRPASSGGAPSAPSLPVDVARTIPAPQTLVQPDLPRNLLSPKEIPIPLVLMWSPKNDPVRQILPPPPQPVVANVHPSIETPNHELNIADLKVSATVFATDTPAPLPSTTAPLVVHGPEETAKVPAPPSKSTVPPTPARVMSLSDIQLEHGTLVLPLINETAPAGSAAVLLPGLAENSSGTSNGRPANQQNGNGPGESSGNRAGNAAPATGSGGQNGTQPGSGLATGLGPGAGARAGPESGAGSSNEPALTRIDVPHDGHFGVVVVGSSMAEEYPETVGLWGGRMAYTVYLHVGLPKSWILQYGVPRGAEASAAGNVARPDAPWPYTMERFQLAPGDSDADAIMVHGFVNVAGRFEKLSVVFPPQFPQEKFVTDALAQWQFRPATLNGKIAAVEVLLIIPDQPD
jgi:hypothetical protein